MAVAFRAKLWNIGAEAQLYAGAVATVVLGTGALPLPAVLLLPILALAAVVAGAIVLLVPALSRRASASTRWVTTLLFTSSCCSSSRCFWKVSEGSDGPRLAAVAAPRRGCPAAAHRHGKRLHWGFILAIACAIGVWIVMARTTLGYAMRAVGHNAKAAAYAGIPVNRVLVWTAVLSGGLAALAGFSEVAGLKGNLTLDLSPGFGYTGIVVAMLALLNPLGVVASAIFVAAIFVGADAMSRAPAFPPTLRQVMVATALLFMVVAIMLTRFRVRWR